MIVYCREYDSANVSKVEFERFNRWAERNAAAEVSAWRSRLSDDDVHWYIWVVDDTDDQRTLTFDWRGRTYEFEPAMGLALVERRLTNLFERYLAGETGRETERIHYGEAIAPRLHSSGVWEFPPGGQG